MTSLRCELAKLEKCPRVTKVEYDCFHGDDRSLGNFSVSFSLPFGRVEIDELVVDSCGGIARDESKGTVSLDGEEVEEVPAEEEGLDLDVPHCDGGMKALARWESTAKQSLKEDLQSWVDALWADVEEFPECFRGEEN